MKKGIDFFGTQDYNTESVTTVFLADDIFLFCRESCEDSTPHKR
jgi:hypothetical protein